MEGYLTIKEAAERLGISERTVRRRIRDGSLPAELRPGQYGQQYFIKDDFIETAQAITDVVEVKRGHDARALSMAIVQTVNEAIAASQEPLREEIAELQDELKKARAQQEETAALLRELLERQRRPWWQFWKKSNT